jgi:hypothetical protein
VLKYGLLNGMLTEFASVQKLIKQVPLHIPYCKHRDFSGIEAFITDISNGGELLSAEHDIKTDLLRLDIVHELPESNQVIKTGAYNEGYSKGFDVAYD